MIEAAGRFEFKYVVPLSVREELLKLVRQYVREDPHAGDLGGGRRGYQVRSIYYDGDQFPLYGTRLDSEKVRTVLRVRSYADGGDDQPVFLEAKRKLQERVVKHRVKVGRLGEYEGPSMELLKRHPGRAGRRFVGLIEKWQAKPRVLVHYEREIFLPRGFDDQQTRLTLDTNIRAMAVDDHRAFQGTGELVIPDGWIVMEQKFNRVMPEWMRRLSAHLELVSESVSKFALGLSQTHRINRPHEVELFMP